MTLRRRGVVAIAIAAVAAALIAVFGLTSQAEATSYRYWTYWLGGSGSWEFSTRGADRVPADGTVDGWRFAISEEAASSSTPRVSSSFDAICGDTEPVPNRKRVGLVLDFGTAAEAPPGESPPATTVARCVVVPTTANAYEVLVATTSIRVDDGMVCGVAGYPSSGCGESVPDPKPSDDGGGDAGSGDNADKPTPGADSGAESAGPTDQGAVGDPAPEGSNPASDKKTDRQPKPGQNDEPEPSGSPTPEALTSAAAATLPTADDGSPFGLIAGLALLGSLAVTGLLFARRRR